MTPKRLAIIMTAGVIVYMVFAGWRGFLLMASGDITGILLGVAILIFPLIGAYLLWKEISFGLRAAELGREFSAAGLLDPDDLPRTPSGRIQPEAAAARFALVKSAVEAEPTSPSCWYRLAVAYEDARDRKAARAAMKRAIELS